MSPAALSVPTLPLHAPLRACLLSWLRRSVARPSGYDRPPPADVYRAILEKDSVIQPETLARMYW